MKNFCALAILCLIHVPLARAAEQTAPAQPPAEVQAAETEKPTEEKRPETVDISDLEQDYWRPNKDELEVVQNRRFQKAKRFEFTPMYGIYQGSDYLNSTAGGAAITYNFSNQFFIDISAIKVWSRQNDLYNSFKAQYNVAPNYSAESHQEVLSAGWTPIYAKFSLLGKKISHFEMYFAPGIGLTKTTDDHISAHFTIGQKFFITEHLIFRLEWRMSRYSNRVYSTVGSTTKANGGTGYFDQTENKHNILFGLGWMF